MPQNKKGVLLECDESGIILTVIYDNLEEDTSGWVGFPFFSLIDINSLEEGLSFWESVWQFGHAEAWPVTLNVKNMMLSLSFTGARMGQSVMLMGYQSDGALVSIDRSEITPLPQVTPSNGTTLAEGKTEELLLEELSRLNNELVNAKRELIRQNIKLKRLQNPWDQGLTFI